MLKCPLFAHQAEGVRFLVGSRNRVANGRRLRGCILADDMGLGKTRTALVAALVHKTENPACQLIVVAPKSLLRNWKREAAQVGVTIDRITTNHASAIPEGVNGPFIVIVDEAHAFQNPDSARTGKLLSLVNGFKIVDRKTVDPATNKVVRKWKETVTTGTECLSVYLLSGTPIKNGRPHNLLPLLQTINHGLAVNVKNYLFTYCGPKNNGFGWTFDGATNLDKLYEMLKGSILRRTKGECLDLPAKTRVLREVELTAAQDAEYEKVLNAIKAEYQERRRTGKIKAGGETLVLLGQLRRAGSIAKADAAIEIGNEVLEEGGQVIIFTCFKESAEKIAAAFGVVPYTGETSGQARQKLVDDFQEGKTKVFVGTVQAGGVGITLHAFGKCQNVVLVDRPWTPGDAVQVEDRAHRIGQPNAVTATWLQHGIIDDTVDGILASKAENASEVLTGTREGLEFTESEVAEAVIDALAWR